MSTAAEIKKRGYCDMCPSFGWGCSTCPALARAHRETAATPTGSAGLSDDRLAESGDDIDGFMAALAEWTALQSYRFAQNPLSREVPLDELEAYSRAKRHLRAALSRDRATEGGDT